jgi:hypothetical protein
MNRIRFVILISAAASASVAHGQLFQPRYREDKAHPIHTITIARDVPMPKRMLSFGQSEMFEEAGAAAATGAAGVGLVAGSSFKPSAGNYFGVPESLRSEFAAAIQKSGRFTVKNQGPADAELRLQVGGYGFNASAPFARRVNPVLSVRAELIRPDGTVVWKFRTQVTHLSSGTPAVLPEEIRSNPEVGVNAFRVAARLIAQKAAETLQK